MSIFKKLKKSQYISNWNNACLATPKFYRKPDGTAFGAIALTESTETILPELPQNVYQIDGIPVSEWRLILVSTTRNTIIGDADYFTELKALKKYVLDKRDDKILLRGLSLLDMENLVK